MRSERMTDDADAMTDDTSRGEIDRVAPQMRPDSRRPRAVISVVIPHLNQPDGLRDCLDSIASQSLPAELFEVIVVDNGSRQLPDAIVAAHGGMRLLSEARPGPGLARNAGALQAKGEILAFIDADCRAHPDWLASIRTAFARGTPSEILGGDVQIWRDRDKPVTGVEAYESV